MRLWSCDLSVIGCKALPSKSIEDANFPFKVCGEVLNCLPTLVKLTAELMDWKDLKFLPCTLTSLTLGILNVQSYKAEAGIALPSSITTLNIFEFAGTFTRIPANFMPRSLLHLGIGLEEPESGLSYDFQNLPRSLQTLELRCSTLNKNDIRSLPALKSLHLSGTEIANKAKYLPQTLEDVILDEITIGASEFPFASKTSRALTGEYKHLNWLILPISSATKRFAHRQLHLLRHFGICLVNPPKAGHRHISTRSAFGNPSRHNQGSAAMFDNGWQADFLTNCHNQSKWNK